MNKSQRAAAIVLTVCCAWLAAMPASARPWKPTPVKMAQDYLLIQDDRGHGEMVMVVWFAPKMAGQEAPAAGVLDKYVVLAVVHGRPGMGGLVFDEVKDLAVKDNDGDPLKPIAEKDIPSDLAPFLMTVAMIYKSSLGALGQGIHFFVFEPGKVHSCQKGGLSLDFAGETYTFDTPIPGCDGK